MVHHLPHDPIIQRCPTLLPLVSGYVLHQSSATAIVYLDISTLATSHPESEDEAYRLHLGADR